MVKAAGGGAAVRGGHTLKRGYRVGTGWGNKATGEGKAVKPHHFSHTHLCV